jgi:hypothetical protein
LICNGANACYRSRQLALFGLRGQPALLRGFASSTKPIFMGRICNQDSSTP